MKILQLINNAVWGIPLVAMILGVGLYLTCKTGFPQIRLLPNALKKFFRREKKDDNSKKALFTALAATVGTGNLAGVAGAIALGGPGAIFWIWVSGLVGMVTKFAEATLAVRYSEQDKSGYHIGGTMYMIKNGMKGKYHWLAGLYCFFGVVASFGIGNAAQVNTATESIRCALKAYNILPGAGIGLIIGLLFAGVIISSLWSGGGGVGKIANRLVPFGAIAYLMLGSLVLIFNSGSILPALRKILEGAFSPAAVTGGAVGSIFIALRTGASRGVFTNEAGMGTAGIAHGSAAVNHPVEQGLLGIVEVFIDTIVICTVTALMILTSSVTIPYGTDPGIALTTDVLAAVFGPMAYILMAVTVSVFALATVLGWSYYGARCAEFIFGNSCWKKYVILQTVVALVSSVLQTDTVWILSDIVNGLMAIPNLTALLALSPEFIFLCRDYKKYRHL